MNSKKASLFFLVLLILSLLLLVFVDIPGSPTGPNFVEQERDLLATMLIVAQLTVPVISMLGLITTTYFSWRKDRREQLQQEFEMRNKAGYDPPAPPGSTKAGPEDNAENDLVSVDKQTHVSD